MIEAVPHGNRELHVSVDEPPAKALRDIAAYFDIPSANVTVDSLSADGPEVVLRADGEELLAVPIEPLWVAVTTTAEVLQNEPTAGLDSLSVIEQLETSTFRSQSVPQLVVASRYIERQAERCGDGTLYACFQQLSRVRRDLRTLLYYTVLAKSDLDVHLFGRPDIDLTDTDELIVHETTSDELTSTWLVAYDGDGDDDPKGALVAEEIGPRRYRGFWTFEADRVDSVIEYLTETYLS